MWSTVNSNGVGSGCDVGSGHTVGHFPFAVPAEPRESGDDEDILGLINSSLDRFNAQLHHTPQADMLIALSKHNADCTGASWTDDAENGIPSNTLNSITSAWEHFAGATSKDDFQQQSRRGQGAPESLVQPALSTTFSTRPEEAICSSAGIAALVLHQQHHKQTSNMLKPICLEEYTFCKQRSLSQTFSDSDETSFLWDSDQKALPSNVGVLSVDSGIDGETFFPSSWFVTAGSSSSNSTGDCGHFTSAANFTSVDIFPPQSAVADSVFELRNPTQGDATFKQAVEAAAAAASVVGDTSKRQQSDFGPATKLSPLFWPPSWPNTAECSPSTEMPQLHFRPGENHQRQFALTSSYETAFLKQKQQHYQQQQQSRRVCNRRKAESVCLSSTMRVNSPLLQYTNILKSCSQAVNVGQLGSPVGSPLAVDLCQPLSKSYSNAPQKLARDLQQQRIAGAFSKTCDGMLGAPRMVNLRGGASCRPKRTEATRSTSSSSSASSSESFLDKPVVAKWRRACSFYLRGHCKKEDCEFAHDLTKVTCKFWEVGECFKGLTCPFLHGYPPELLLEAQGRQDQQQLQQQKAEQLAGK